MKHIQITYLIRYIDLSMPEYEIKYTVLSEDELNNKLKDSRFKRSIDSIHVNSFKFVDII